VSPAPGTTLPSPEGCFVQVWEQPFFTGPSDYINGPRRYPTVGDMPGRRDWRNRIRSLKVASSASVTVWSEENFSGSAVRAARNAAHPELPDSLTARIQSIVVECDSNAGQ
jgi:hypothetical protein